MGSDFPQFRFIKESLEDTKKEEEKEKEREEERGNLARKYPEDSNIKIED